MPVSETMLIKKMAKKVSDPVYLVGNVMCLRVFERLHFADIRNVAKKFREISLMLLRHLVKCHVFALF